MHGRSLPDEIRKVSLALGEELDDAAVRARVASICKRLVRVGYELVMERENAFTRDLYFCTDLQI